MIGAAWNVSTYAMAATGLFALLIFMACIADLAKWRHNIADSVLLCILVAFGVFGAVAIVSLAFSLTLSVLWLMFGWW